MKRSTAPCGARPPLCHAGQGGPHVGARSTDVDNFSARGRSKRLGALFEAQALEYLEGQRLRLVARNVTCRGGEIDLVMRECDDSLVFVEVRARAGRDYGGAIASVSHAKRRRLVHAAQYFLATRGDASSACRFDVIAFEECGVVWLRDAFRADGI